MGNALMTPCFHQSKKLSLTSSSSSSSSSSSVKLIFWQSTTRSLNGSHIAGDITLEYPETMVCHADSFFIGQPIPILALDDELMQGESYYVLPIDCFSSKRLLSVSSLLSLGSHNNNNSNTSYYNNKCPFEYLKDSDGKVLIKVLPEFITRLINGGDKGHGCCHESNESFLCSTPELKKHYNMLVKPKDRVWSPKLETILEYKNRGRFIRLERKEKEKGNGVV